MQKEFPHFIPAPPPAADIFASYQLVQEFHREVEYRQEFECYCEWYRLTAERHRQEFRNMRGDINLFGWFCRRKR